MGSCNGSTPTIEPTRRGRARPVKAALAGRRAVVFATAGAIETPVLRSQHLRHGNRIPGPAIIEAPTTTIVVHPDQEATVDAYGNIALTGVTEGGA